MKFCNTFVIGLLATVLLASTSVAQVTAGGLILPRQKTCELEAPNNPPEAGCTVTVIAQDTGLKCENGKKKITLKVTITCGGETCRDYPTLDNCEDDNVDFPLGCHGDTITLGSTSSWTDLMGPNGNCDTLTAKISH